MNTIRLHVEACHLFHRVVSEIFISASSATMLPEGRLFSACFLAGLITSAAALPAGSGTGNSGTTGSGTTGAGNALPVDIPEGGSHLALPVIPALSTDLRILQVLMAIPLIQQTPLLWPTINSFRGNRQMQIQECILTFIKFRTLSPSVALTVERIRVHVRMLHCGCRDVYSYNHR